MSITAHSVLGSPDVALIGHPLPTPNQKFDIMRS
jgi:hypothetical protein